MIKLRFVLAVFAGLALCASLDAQPPRKKKLLFIGATKGFQHDSVSNAAATVWKLGQESGIWDAYIKTDTQLVTKQELKGNAKNLKFFDAVVFYTTGELDMDDSQKADLISFVKEDGKGFMGIHSATDTFYKWAEYGDMIGGYFDGHPWGTFEAPLVVEDAGFPGMSAPPSAFTMRDEIYQVRDYSRDKVRVLMRLDDTKINMNQKGVKRTDRDFAVIWARTYGKGRVLYNGLGHVEAVYDRPEIQKMMTEHIKWILGLAPGDATPRPKPAR